MRTTLLITLLCTCAVFTLAQDCNSPLLKNPRIVQRFGQQNIAPMPFITGNLTMCFYLTNQQVCVKNEGYSNFMAYLKTWKQNFIEDIYARDTSRFTSLITASSLPNPVNCEKKFQAITLVTQVANWYKMYNSSATVYNFTDASNTFRTQNYTAAEKYRSSRRVYSMSNVQLLWGNLTRQKTDCFRAVLKHEVGLTCLASNPNYKEFVSGTPDSPILNLNTKSCEYFRTYCHPFFFTAKRMKEVRNTFSMCTDPVTDPVISLLGGNITDQVNEQLTSLAKVIVAQNVTELPYAKIECDDDNLGASDCDFVCQSVINSTDLNPQVLNDVMPPTTTATKLLLTDPTITVTDNGFRPEGAISDDEVNMTTVVPPAKTVSAHSLFVTAGILTVIAIFF